MRVRVKFSKYGNLKFIGHLDVLRFFQKAIRRAGIDVAYSKGFSPHQIMSFASPLGIGITSDGEYMDVELNTWTYETEQEFIDCLNFAMTEGFLITEAVILPEPEPNRKRETAMAQVTAADYKLSLKYPDAVTCYGKVISKKEIKIQFEEFLNQKTIPIQKKTKTQELELDLCSFLYAYGFDAEEFSRNSKRDLSIIHKGELHADNYGDTFSIYLRLCAGSKDNVKPELVIDAFLAYSKFECRELSIQEHRMELYRTVSEGEKDLAFQPLIYIPSATV